MGMIFTTLKGVVMKVMSAREAKNRFGEFLDAARRAPVVVTKNDRPVAIMISIEDASESLVQDLFMDQEPGYEAWLARKVTRTITRVKARKTGLHEHADAMALLRGRIGTKLARKPA